MLEIKRLASLFCVCEFSLIPNDCNSLALELAAYACNDQLSTVYRKSNVGNTQDQLSYLNIPFNFLIFLFLFFTLGDRKKSNMKHSDIF